MNARRSRPRRRRILPGGPGGGIGRHGGLKPPSTQVGAGSNPAPGTTNYLRRTYATLALKAGIHPKIVSERLGHATVGITLDLYSHVTPSIAREAADVVAAGIFS